MDVAAMLLTGGASLRMGRDKATLALDDGETLSQRTARVLSSVAAPVVEVGPGTSGLPAVADARPGAGPLAAMATGAAWLTDQGWTGPALVVATDLPNISGDLLRWLADYPVTGSVVPLDRSGRPQGLCARYQAGDLALAIRLVAGGRRAVSDLLQAAPDVTTVPADAWAAVAGPGSLRDADTPADLSAAGRGGEAAPG